VRRSRNPSFLLRLSLAFPLLLGGLVTLGVVESACVHVRTDVEESVGVAGAEEESGTSSERSPRLPGSPVPRTPRSSRSFGDDAIFTRLDVAVVANCRAALDGELARLKPGDVVVGFIVPDLLLSKPPPALGWLLPDPPHLRVAEARRTLRSPRAPPRA